MQKRFLILAVLLFSATGAFAINLEQAVSLALENNITIKKEQITLNASERASKHSWNSLIPSVSVNANDEVLLSGTNGLQNSTTLEGRVTATISSDFFISIKKAQVDYEAARITYEEAVAEIISQVKEAYFSLLYEKENLNYLRENLENARHQTLQNEERYKRGTLSELEYLSSKVAYEKLKPELKAQELAFENNVKSFYLILGIENLESNENKNLPEGSLENFISEYTTFFNDTMKAAVSEEVAKGNLPSVQLLKKQLEASQKEVSRTKLSVWGPSINLSYSINPVLSGEEKGSIKQSGTIGVSIPLENLLPCSRGADSIKTAQDSVEILRLQFEEQKNKVKTDFASILKSVEQKQEAVSTMKDYVQLAQKNYKAAELAYSKGTMELLSMQNAAKENLEAKLNLQNEFLENLKLYIALEKLTGKNFLLTK